MIISEEVLYKQRIKEWRINQIRTGKSNMVPGQGTRDRIRREVKEFIEIETEKNKKKVSKKYKSNPSKRAKDGYTFEDETCRRFGWDREEVKPKMCWIGKGNNYEKIKSSGCDPTKFDMDLKKSILVKYDAITQDGLLVEIKKYNINKCKDWILFSELLPCVKNYSDIPKILNTFGQDEDMLKKSKILLKQRKLSSGIDKKKIDEEMVDMGKSVSDSFNNFMNKLGEKISTEYDIINKLTEKLHGIQVINHLIIKDDLEFKWFVSKNWCNCIRYYIMFRIKPEKLHKY